MDFTYFLFFKSFFGSKFCFQFPTLHSVDSLSYSLSSLQRTLYSTALFLLFFNFTLNLRVLYQIDWSLPAPVLWECVVTCRTYFSARTSGASCRWSRRGLMTSTPSGRRSCHTSTRSRTSTAALINLVRPVVYATRLCASKCMLAA